MAGPLNAKVILSRCSKTKQSFGVRIEERGNDWVRTWAFEIDEEKARHEGFDTNTVTGSMIADDKFPGCPYCKSPEFVQCVCEKIGCGGEIKSGFLSAKYACPWCGKSVPVFGANSFNVSSGGF